ncbi:MAG TPA: VWA domain-containing protein [Acidimicrobiales bacterium]|nr:VWA domain-containing protein [Acidimicrobiales bacterium]
MGALRWRYERWTGAVGEGPAPPGADDVLAAAADDLAYHGDLDAALRRLLREGFTTAAGRRVAGLRELLEEVRRRRRELLAAHDADGLTRSVREELDAIVERERAELEARVAAARGEDAPPSARSAGDAALEALGELDLLPAPLGQRLAALQRYEFASPEAASAFSRLIERLRRSLVELQLSRAAGLAAASPAERARLGEALDALSTLLEQRRAGLPLEPDFSSFVERFGDLFPPAEDLDGLLARLASRLQAAGAVLASMTPAERAELEALAAGLLADEELGRRLDRLAAALAGTLAPLEPVDGPGGLALSFEEASDVAAQLAELSELEAFLAGTDTPAALAEADLERVAELVSRDAAASLEALAQLTRRLEAEGLVARRGERLALTPRGLRRLGAHALGEVFSRLGRARSGEHLVLEPGPGHERAETTRPYEPGDAFDLNVERTLRNGLVRLARARETPSVALARPIALSVEDFEIDERERVTGAASVLALDLSLSMPMRDNFLAAKKVALALQSLIASRYPRDFLGLIGFSATARVIEPSKLAEVSWDYTYGTNLQHALALSRRMLAHRRGTRQVLLVTDGEPTAHVEPDGQVFFSYPPTRETIEETLAEVARCTREKIVINTFALDATGSLRRFVETMARLNGGRAFFATPEDLGPCLLVDFVSGHRATRRLAGA